MEFKNLKHIRDFKKLKKGDILIVEWNDYMVKHTQNCRKVELYHIVENREHSAEIICRIKGNHYFNYERYLKNLSNAIKVVQVNT